MRTRAALVACLLLLLGLSPTAAGAQNTLTITESSQVSPGYVNIAECTQATSDVLSFNWNFGTTALTIARTDIYVSDTGGCPSGSGSRKSVDSVTQSPATGPYPTGGGGIQPLTLLQLLGFDCGSSRSLFVCAFPFDALGNAIANLSAAGTITIDASVPAAPTVGVPQPGDGALQVSWTPGTGGGSVGSWKIVARDLSVPPSDPVEHTRTITTSGTTSGRISGLTNLVTYTVSVFAYSPGENESPESNLVTGTPEPVDDFWRHYKGVGGREEGGCGGGGAGALSLLALALWGARRAGRRA